MNKSKDFPEWFLWAWEHAAGLILGGGLFCLLVGGIVVYIDQRLDEVEERLNYLPPRSYQPPKLEDFVLGDEQAEDLPPSRTVYVPIYSHVYYQGGSPYPLETTLSIRNTDPDAPVFLTSVRYFDTSGRLVKTYLDQTLKLKPLQTMEYLVERRDSTGGSGANFLVEWTGQGEVEIPLIEAVMVGTAGTQGISFVRQGMEISK